MAVSEASICRKEAAVEPSGTISRRLAKEIPFAEALQNNKYTYALSPCATEPSIHRCRKRQLSLHGRIDGVLQKEFRRPNKHLLKNRAFMLSPCSEGCI